MTGRVRIATITAVAGLAVAAATAAIAREFSSDRDRFPLEVVARVTLPGPSAHFDYESVDPGKRRLYIAHMDADRLLVFDLRAMRVIKSLPAPGVHGVLAVPALDRVYASETNARQILTIDARSESIVARAPAGEYPDGLAYDPDDGRVFDSDELGGILTEVTAGGRRVTSIQLGGEAGNVQYDPVARHILVDVQTGNEVAVPMAAQ
jgi:DNA-binding beta-propeller fold protein YncE